MSDRFVADAGEMLLVRKSKYAIGASVKFNPNHGPDGRFTSGDGRGGSARDLTNNVKSTSRLGGGVNETQLVEYEEGGQTKRGVFKPQSGENQYSHPAFKGTQTAAEVSASIVGEEMGLDMVAKTERVTIKGQEGSLQSFVNDTAELAYTYADKAGSLDPGTGVRAADYGALRNVKGVDDMLYYDALVGNADRHLANWMVKDGQVKLIDNGMSFAKNASYDDIHLRFRTMEHDPSFRMARPMSQKFRGGLDKMLGNKGRVDARLKAAGLDKERRESFWKRAEYLQKSRRFGFGKGTLEELGKLAEGEQLFGF